MIRLKVLPFVCGAMALLHVAAFAQTPSPFKVDWSNERLSIKAADAPLADVVTEVARQIGMDVIGLEKLNGRLTIDVAAQPKADGLAALLTGVNHVLQMRTAAEPGAAPRLTLLVHSMSAGTLTAALANPPMAVPVLDALIASEIAAEAEEAAEAEDDPDSDDDRRDDKMEASRLAAEGEFGPDADLASLIEHMDDANVEIRLEALQALSKRPLKQTLEPIVAALGDDASAVSRAAIEILGRMKDPTSLTRVGQLLEKHPDTGMAISALRVLALRADPLSAVHLRAALKHEYPTVNEAAAQMLAEFDRRARAAAARPAR